MDTIRVGHGYDVHKFKKGRKLILGGVDVPHSRGLDGHSDADVLIHAICDALLGSAALGDIGVRFPPKDDAYLNIDSRILLRKTVELLKKENFIPVNVDATVIAQEPKLAGYIAEMRKNISNDLNTDISNVSIKATTEEGLGFTGKRQGIAAHAVCLVRPLRQD